MSLITIGKMTLNTDYVQHIFEDADEPGTWIVIMNSPLARKKDVGPVVMPSLVFSGEEGEALAWYVSTLVPNLIAMKHNTRRTNSKYEEALLRYQATREKGTWDDSEVADNDE